MPSHALLFPSLIAIGRVAIPNVRREAPFRRCIELAEMGYGGKDGQITKIKNLSCCLFSRSSFSASHDKRLTPSLATLFSL
ncbi:MAG: hypothetical protein BWY70_01092 [Bacteroidetes bacterium ADurb.Bin408]|nr:MAG: hypothetical protein BWY70_01092 [Bacteroidetes bacterium ADurb.Bin408]